MSNFLIALSVFLITVMGALFAVPYFIDWNGYRGAFEEEASRLLGREVRVSGAVNLHLLPTPYFSFEKVRIADTSVNLQEPFFRADALTVKLTVPPLLRGVLEANQVEFKRPILRLALDNKDGWNWQGFSEALANATYLPSNIALTSVKISDGVLALHGPDGAERTRFEGFNGELSAPAIEGPYRLRGNFGSANAEREIRITTARPEPDGSVRFKAALRASETASVYLLDARLIDLMGKPRLEGELTAQLPIAGLLAARSAADAPKRQPSLDDRLDSGEAFDLKAMVKADADGAALSNLALSFEQDGRPQLASGNLNVRWRQAFKLDINLAAHWLDLDRIAGTDETAGPLAAIVPIAIRMRDLLPVDGRSRASFSIDQAQLGRDTTSGIRLALVRSGDKLDVEELRLGMPGGSRGELRGSVSGSREAPVFDGSVSVRGTSLLRFLHWAAVGMVPTEAKGDGAFGLRTRLIIAPDGVIARDAVGDLLGTAVRGAAHYRWEGRPELSLVLEGPQVDVRPFIPAGSSLPDVLDLVLHGPAANQPSSPVAASRAGWRGGRTDVRVRLNAGQLVTAAHTYRDVAIDAELRGGKLALPRFRIGSDDGFSLELEGEVEDALSRPKGSVRAVANAETAASVAPLMDLIGVPASLRRSSARIQGWAPLRLAGSMSFGLRTPTSADIVIDGEVNGATVKLNGRFDGGRSGWRSGPADVTAQAQSSNAGTIAALIGSKASSSRAEVAAPGRVLVKASGVPATGLATIASVEAGDMALGFRGQLVATEQTTTATGDLDVTAGDGAHLATLVGLSPAVRLDGLPISGSLKVSVENGKVGMERIALKVGGSEVRGSLALSTAGERRHVDARLDIDEIAVTKLMSPLLDQRLAITSAAESAVSGRQILWPDDPFDASVFAEWQGDIRLTSRRVVLGDGIAIKAATLDVGLAGGKVDVRRLEGAGLGGRCSVNLQIEKVPAGAQVTGVLRLAGGSLQAIAGGDKPAETGDVSGEIKFSGKGTSPRAIISVLQGAGTLTFANARLPAPWPGAIDKGVEAAMHSEPDKLAGVLRQALTAGLRAGKVPLPATVALEVADGQLRAQPFTIDTGGGRAAVNASLDLRTLVLDSEWRLEQNVATGDKPALPAVTVGYRGPVTALAAIEPRVGSEALERELSVRRMERDVEELERLRRLDEARRRSEADRLRQLERPAPPVIPAPLPIAPVPVAPGAPAEARPATPG